MKDMALKYGIWIYRALAILLCCFMLLSFILPWWSADVSVIQEPGAIRVYGWGLRHNLNQYSQYIAQDETPFYQTVLAWVYMALSILLLTLSTWLKDKKGAILTLVVGAGYLTYTLVALFGVISPRLEETGLVLQGTAIKTVLIKNVTITSSLQQGYYLACAVGAVCILLGLIRFILTMRKSRRQRIASSSKTI
jgi:hypothetical protein